MFGFVVANGDALSEAQKERYRGCYCGLCRALKERHGELSRLTLNYDMAFLTLLLSGMYEPEERSGSSRCGVHPVKPRSWWRSRFTDYAADMTVVLAYYNCLDDVADERKLLPRVEARALRSRYLEAKSRWSGQVEAVEARLAELGELEREKCAVPDAAADCFGRLMGALFAVEPDALWAPRLREFGERLGRFIYMMDACVDIERDRKSGSYNPLLCLEREMSRDEQAEALKLLAGDCTEAFEALPIVQDVDILRNVLYSGVWTQFELTLQKEKKGASADA